MKKRTMSIMKGSSPESAAIKMMDQLVSENVIIYGPHQVIKHEDEGYPVSLSQRPRIQGGNFV